MGVLAVARKSCGGPLSIFEFYWIFMTKFLEKNLGVHGVRTGSAFLVTRYFNQSNNLLAAFCQKYQLSF
jgi:Na+/melibiose symporter-like transporter